jgi:hypothetical protein
MSIEAVQPFSQSQSQSQPQPKQKHQYIEWRRERIAELSAQGRTAREICTILKVGLGTVSRDLSYLNKQARDNLQFHIQERLPAQYRECQNGLAQVLKMAWNIVMTESVNQANKLQALSLISDCYRHQMDLSTNAGVISEAMHFATQAQSHIDSWRAVNEKEREKTKQAAITDVSESDTNTNTNMKTTNGVF